MRGLIATIFFMIFLLFAIVETEVPETKEEEWQNVKPDSGREPHHFDWNTNKYVYTDQIKPDSEIVDWGALTSKPDYSVRIEGGYNPPKPRIISHGKSLGGMGFRLRRASDPPEIKINGKYYRQYERADGVIQLIPIR